MIGQRPGDARLASAELWQHYTEAPERSALRRPGRPAAGSATAARVQATIPWPRPCRSRPTSTRTASTAARAPMPAPPIPPPRSCSATSRATACISPTPPPISTAASTSRRGWRPATRWKKRATRHGGSTIMIRSGDAHAWPEIFLEDVGWVVVDLAPQTTLDEPIQAPDRALQRMLGEMMRQQDDEEWLEDELREQDRLRRRSPASCCGSSWRCWRLAYAVKLYRGLAPRFVRPRQLYRVAYRAALDRLAGDRPQRRRYGESRERFRRAQRRALSPSFARLTEEHLKSALGSRRLGDGKTRDAPRWRTPSAASFGSACRRGSGCWRRSTRCRGCWPR